VPAEEEDVGFLDYGANDGMVQINERVTLKVTETHPVTSTVTATATATATTAAAAITPNPTTITFTTPALGILDIALLLEKIGTFGPALGRAQLHLCRDNLPSRRPMSETPKHDHIAQLCISLAAPSDLVALVKD